jgi:pimeloyl-ACP methyl ester carboxylesterase
MESLDAGIGRVLDVLVGGAEGGPALVMHHGTPSDATLWDDWDAIASERGVRLLSISRPGYATSTRQPGRRVAAVAADVESVLRHFDVPWFVTAGWSGGGPHALACAARPGSQCRAAATLAGVGAYGVADLDFLAGMGPENHAEFDAALRGEADVRSWLAANAETMRSVTGPELADAFGGLVPQADKDVLAGGFADSMAATMRRALEGGFDGWIDDDLAFIQPWGFDRSGCDLARRSRLDGAVRARRMVAPPPSQCNGARRAGSRTHLAGHNIPERDRRRSAGNGRTRLAKVIPARARDRRAVGVTQARLRGGDTHAQ